MGSEPGLLVHALLKPEKNCCFNAQKECEIETAEIFDISHERQMSRF